MHFLGRYVDKQRGKLREMSQRYDAGDAATKQQILDEYREELMKDARATVEKAQGKMAERSEKLQRRCAFMAKQQCVFINATSLGAGHIKYTAAADPDRSTVRPLQIEAAQISSRQHVPITATGGFTEMV